MVIENCGGLTVQELPGWGYDGTVEMKSGSGGLNDGELSLSFADYPSEVYDQNGIVCFEKNSGIVYSADLFLRYGGEPGSTMKANWSDEVDAIPADNIVSDLKLPTPYGVLNIEKLILYPIKKAQTSCLWYN